MLKRFFRGVLTLMGTGLGIGLGFLVNWFLESFELELIPNVQEAALLVAFALIFGIIFFLMANRIMKVVSACLKWVERKLSDVPAHDIFFGSLGLVIGLFIAFLISSPIRDMRIKLVSIILTLAIYMLFAYLGINIAVKRREELASLFLFRRQPKKRLTRKLATGWPRYLTQALL